jgi:Fe-S-cluster containining protein
VIDDAPLYLTPMVRAWACRKRGLCCRHHQVPIDEIERRRLERRLREDGDPLASRFSTETIPREGERPLLPQDGEQCVFLGSDNLCRVRTRLGERVYPSVCRKYPFLSIHTGERQVFGLSFQCPTALQLLAEETRFEVQVEVGSEPPVDRVAWLGDAERECFDLSGRRLPVGAFWELHWSLFERFRARPEAHPTQRLIAFSEEVTGLEAPAPVKLRRAIFRQGAFEPSVVEQLERTTGAAPEGLMLLWAHLAPQSFTLDAPWGSPPRMRGDPWDVRRIARAPAPSAAVFGRLRRPRAVSGAPGRELPLPDEEALVTRYLLHRFLCPASYVSRTDLRLLLTTLFASLARYRIERERGFDPLTAIRNLDRLFVHTPTGVGLHGSVASSPAWRAMASLARAVTVG